MSKQNGLVTARASKTGKLVDSRFLSTVDLHKHGARVALISCMNDGKSLMSVYANSSYFEAICQNFVFFDSRYYREMKATYGTKKFFGAEQIDWSMNARTRRSQGRPPLAVL